MGNLRGRSEGLECSVMDVEGELSGQEQMRVR